MEWVETTGRTIEEAKDAALDQLGVDDSDAEFVVVSEPKAGLFGRVRGEARVRARVRPTSPRPKRTRSRRQGEQREGSRRGSGSGRGSSSGARSGGTAGATATTDDGSAGGDVPAEQDRPDGQAGSSGNGAGAPRSRNRRSRSRSGSTRSGAQASDAGNDDRMTDSGEAAQRPASGRGRGSRSAGPTKEETVGEDLSIEEQGESAREFVAGLIEELGLDASVTSRVLDEDTAEVAVDGAELGVLIGPGGATLGALQELARTFVQKRTGGQSSRIMVDVAGYRAKRAAALQRFTRQIAEEVIESGAERALEPMSASDRKVVHDTINEIEGLATRSEGEDPRRYIVISPERVASDEPSPDEAPVDA